MDTALHTPSPIRSSRRPSPVATAAAVAALLLAALLLPATAASAAPAAPGDPLAQAMLDHINGARAAAGAPALGWDVEMAEISQGWSGHMAASGQLAHNPSYRSAYTGEATRFGENVGMARYPGADPLTVIARLHDSFMASSGHRANVLNGAYRSAGIGVVVTAEGRVWVTVNFTDSAPDEVPDPAPAPARGHYRRGVLATAV